MKDYINKSDYSRPKWWQAVLWIMVFSLFILLLLNPEVTSGWALKGCSGALKAIVPYTFPFLVLSSLLISSGCCEFLGRVFSPLAKLFNLPPSCFSAIIISFLCGFPVGGVMVSGMYERGYCNKEQAERLVAFCNFCGPPYIFGVFGGVVMNNGVAGGVAYVTQSLCAVILGIILGRLKRKGEAVSFCLEKQEVKEESLAGMFCNAICRAGESTVNIFAYIVFFSVICGIIDRLLPMSSDIANALVFGFFEMSGGIKALLPEGRELLRYFIGCIIIYFSGASVHLQVVSSLNENISPKLYLLSRLAFAPICATLSTAVYYFVCSVEMYILK